MSVKELRQELSRYNIRWAGLLEKSDLIRAVQQARNAAAHFSVTGLLRPGQVTSLTAEQVQAEECGTRDPRYQKRYQIGWDLSTTSDSSASLVGKKTRRCS